MIPYISQHFLKWYRNPAFKILFKEILTSKRYVTEF